MALVRLSGPLKQQAGGQADHQAVELHKGDLGRQGKRLMKNRVRAHLSDQGFQFHGDGPWVIEYVNPAFERIFRVHVNTLEGFWSLLRSWLRPHRGIPQESLPLYLGFFEFVHNVRARGKRLLGALIGQLLAPPCNPS